MLNTGRKKEVKVLHFRISYNKQHNSAASLSHCPKGNIVQAILRVWNWYAVKSYWRSVGSFLGLFWSEGGSRSALGEFWEKWTEGRPQSGVCFGRLRRWTRNGGSPGILKLRWTLQRGYRGKTQKGEKTWERNTNTNNWQKIHIEKLQRRLLRIREWRIIVNKTFTILGQKYVKTSFN